jgi:hypothetical protein
MAGEVGSRRRLRALTMLQFFSRGPSLSGHLRSPQGRVRFVVRAVKGELRLYALTGWAQGRGSAAQWSRPLTVAPLGLRPLRGPS